MSSSRPNRHFFIVGAQRSGTTYLHSILDEHPEIEMAKPVAPEPKFFLRDDFPVLTRKDYCALFFGRKPSAIRFGEKSTSYIEHKPAIRRIAAWYPDAQLIFLLRNPATRAVSNYHLSKNRGFETLPMPQAFLEEDDRRELYDRTRISASPFAYLKRGRYLDYIRIFENFFRRDQLIFLIYEEFVGRLDQIRALYRTLEVAESFVPPSLATRINARPEDRETSDGEPAQFLADYFTASIGDFEAYLGRAIPSWKR
jgi:hypothetical protein